MTYSENLEEAITEIKEVMTGLKLYENEPMNGHCSMKVGGPVRALAVPSDVFGLTKVCYLLKKHFIAPFILGNGTNIVIPDEGLNIFVMSTEKLQKLWLHLDLAKQRTDARSQQHSQSLTHIWGEQTFVGHPGCVTNSG